MPLVEYVVGRSHDPVEGARNSVVFKMGRTTGPTMGMAHCCRSVVQVWKPYRQPVRSRETVFLPIPGDETIRRFAAPSSMTPMGMVGIWSGEARISHTCQVWRSTWPCSPRHWRPSSPTRRRCSRPSLAVVTLPSSSCDGMEDGGRGELMICCILRNVGKDGLRSLATSRCISLAQCDRDGRRENIPK